jgi:Rad3-related DNA helicase
MMSRRLTREGLERAARELAGIKLSPTELEALLRRLQSLREELEVLEEWSGSGCEPLPAVVI